MSKLNEEMKVVNCFHFSIFEPLETPGMSVCHDDQSL